MLKVRDIMTREVLTVSPENTVRDAVTLLASHHVSGAPVVSGEKLVGVVTATDLLSFASALPQVAVEREEQGSWFPWAAPPESAPKVRRDDEGPGAYFSEPLEGAGVSVARRMASVEGAAWNVLEEHKVSEVMYRPPLVTLPADAAVEAAADLMKNLKIHRVLVTENDRLAGIVTSLDVARAVADHRLTTRTYVFNPEADFRDVDTQ